MAQCWEKEQLCSATELGTKGCCLVQNAAPGLCVKFTPVMGEIPLEYCDICSEQDEILFCFLSQQSSQGKAQEHQGRAEELLRQHHLKNYLITCISSWTNFTLVLSANIVYCYMPLLYILSLGYAIRLTIFFAMMGSVHVLPKFSFFPLLPLSLPIVVFLAFIVEREKNDQEASLVFRWRTSKTDIVSNVSTLKWIWWTDLWLKEGELRRISQFLLDMPEHNTSPHSHFFPHLFSFLNVFFPLHFTYVEEKKNPTKNHLSEKYWFSASVLYARNSHR